MPSRRGNKGRNGRGHGSRGKSQGSHGKSRESHGKSQGSHGRGSSSRDCGGKSHGHSHGHSQGHTEHDQGHCHDHGHSDHGHSDHHCHDHSDHHCHDHSDHGHCHDHSDHGHCHSHSDHHDHSHSDPTKTRRWSDLEAPLDLDPTLPGAPGHPSVQQATGQVSLTRDLFTLAASPSLKYTASLAYSSTSARSAKVTNLNTPTGTTGLGWSTNQAQIIRMSGTTASEPRFALSINGTFSWLKKAPSDIYQYPQRWPTGTYVTQPHKFWTVVHDQRHDTWSVTMDDGIKYKFDRHTAEFGIQRGNFYGNGPGVSPNNAPTRGVVRDGQSQQVVVWNLSRMSDQWGNSIVFKYEDDTEALGTFSSTKFTRALRLTRIKSSKGAHLDFEYGSKTPQETMKPHTIASINKRVIRGSFTSETWYPSVTFTVVVKARDTTYFGDPPPDERYEIAVPNPEVSDLMTGVTNVRFEQDIVMNQHVVDVDVTAKAGFKDRKSQSFEQLHANASCEQTDRTSESEYLTVDYLNLDTTNGVTAWQDRCEEKVLTAVSLRDKDDVLISQVRPEYRTDVLEGGTVTKRLLTSLVRTQKDIPLSQPIPEEDVQGNPELFEYYGIADGLSIANPYSEEQGALYGALKSTTSTTGLKLTYEYKADVEAKKSALNIVLRDKLDEEWNSHAPQTYFGPNFVVIGYFKGSKTYVQVWSWIGWWSLSEDIGELNVKQSDFHVSLGTHFFTIWGLPHSQVLLAGQNQHNPAEWVTQRELAGYYAAGHDFVALWMKEQLHIWTLLATGAWIDVGSDDWNVTYSDHDSTKKIVAQGDTIFIMRVQEIEHNNTELVVHFLHRNEEAQWSHEQVTGPTTQWPSTTDDYLQLQLSKQAQLEIQFGSSFIGLRLMESFSRVGHDAGLSNALEEWDSIYAYRWSQDGELYEPELLQPWKKKSANPLVSWSFAVAGNVIHKDYSASGVEGMLSDRRKEVYRFTGTGWDMTRLDGQWSTKGRILGDDLFTMSIDGHSSLYTFDINNLKWCRTKKADGQDVPKWKDGNPNWIDYSWDIFYDVWSLAMLFIPGVGEASLAIEILDAAFQIVDELMSLRAGGGAHVHPGSQYLTANDLVYLADTDGNYNPLEGANRLGATDDDVNKYVFRDATTKAAANFIVYTRVKTKDSGDDDAKTRRINVQFLKNGQFWDPHPDPNTPNKQTSVSLNPRDTDEEDRLLGVGPSSFASLMDGAIYLYRVDDDNVTGYPSNYAVRRVILDDGLGPEIATDFEYNEESALPQARGGAIYGEVTTYYTGVTSSGERYSDASGTKVSYFYAREPAAICPDPWTGSPPPLLLGQQYAEEVFDADGTRVSSWTQQFEMSSVEFDAPFNRPDATAYYVRPTVLTTTSDGQTKTHITAWNPDNGRVKTTIESVTDVRTGVTSQLATFTDYAFERNSDVRKVHKLDAVSAVRRATKTIAAGEDPVLNIPDQPPYIAQTLTVWDKVEGTSAIPIVGPTKTYRALIRDAEVTADGQPATPADWLFAGENVKWTRNGSLIESTTGDAGARGVPITHSSVVDRTELPLATFGNASVQNHEAGYYNWGVHEEYFTPLHGAIWHLNGNSIEPANFSTRSEGYVVVSAYFLVAPDIPEARIGFRDSDYVTTVDLANPTPLSSESSWSPRVPEWRYVEVTAPYSESLGKPFSEYAVSPRDGESTISSFRFSPVDCNFTATTYDPLTRAVTSTRVTNGLWVQRIFDDNRKTAGNVAMHSGKVVSLGWVTNPVRTSSTYKPSQGMSFVTRNDSRYAAALTAGRYDSNIRSDGSVAVQFKAPSESFDTTINCGNWWVTFKNNELKYGIGGKTIDEMSLPSYSIAVTWFLNNYLFVWIDTKFVAKHSSNHQNEGEVVVEVTSGSLQDVCVVQDPIVKSQYTNAQGKLIQRQQLTDDGMFMVVDQTIYNGWGSPEVHTVPGSTSEWSWSFIPNWASLTDDGTLTGQLVNYLNGVHGANPSDSEFGFYRTYAERSPRGRPVAMTLAGEAFQFEDRAVTIEYGQEEDPTTERGQLIASVFAKLGLPQSSQSSFQIVTTYHQIGDELLPLVELIDESGSTVARASGPRDLQQITCQQQTFPRSCARNASSPPAVFASDSTLTDDELAKYTTVKSYDFLGHVTSVTNGDSGTSNSLWTTSGYRRFTASDAHPGVTKVFKYDRIGRVVEIGVLAQAWNPTVLQGHVNDPDYPEAGNNDYTVRTRYQYDVDDNGRSINLKGRTFKSQSFAGGGNVVTDTVTYNDQGSPLVTTRAVSAFDDTVRDTSFEYNSLGAPTKITYPSVKGGAGTKRPVLVLHRDYTRNGRLASLGDHNDASKFASYQYGIDGSLTTAYLNDHRITRHYTTNFQGQTTSIADTERSEGLAFKESLSYVSDAGDYLGGNIAKVEFEGACGAYNVQYAYDPLGRLQSATMKPGPAEQDQVASVYTYDIQDNLTNFTRNQDAVESLAYTNGTNQVDDEDYSYTGGNVTSDAQLSSVTYDSAMALPSTYTPRVETDTTAVPVSFAYSAGGNRVFKAVGSDQERRLYMHGTSSRPLVEFTARAPTSTQEQYDIDTYIYGADGLTSIVNSSGTHFVSHDHMASVRAIFDSNHQLRGSITYDHYGGVPPSHSTGLQHDESIERAEKDAREQSLDVTKYRYLYTGQEYDSESEHYNYGLRVYNPQTGSFLTPDPFKQSNSPYSYANSNPSNYMDPTGGLIVLFSDANRKMHMIGDQIVTLGGWHEKNLAQKFQVMDRVGEEGGMNYARKSEPQFFNFLMADHTTIHDGGDEGIVSNISPYQVLEEEEILILIHGKEDDFRTIAHEVTFGNPVNQFEATTMDITAAMLADAVATVKYDAKGRKWLEEVGEEEQRNISRIYLSICQSARKPPPESMLTESFAEQFVKELGLHANSRAFHNAEVFASAENVATGPMYAFAHTPPELTPPGSMATYAHDGETASRMERFIVHSRI